MHRACTCCLVPSNSFDTTHKPCFASTLSLPAQPWSFFSASYVITEPRRAVPTSSPPTIQQHQSSCELGHLLIPAMRPKRVRNLWFARNRIFRPSTRVIARAVLAVDWSERLTAQCCRLDIGICWTIAMETKIRFLVEINALALDGCLLLTPSGDLFYFA